MTDGEWVTLGEAAMRLETTPDAVRQRIRRNKILARRGNDGRPRVFVEFAHAEQTERAAGERSVIPNRTESGNTEHGELPLVSELRRQLTEQQVRHDADVARRLAERDSLHLDTLGRLQAQAAIERSLLVERVDAAEIRAERVEQRLDQVLDVLLARRRPWWWPW